MSSLRSGAHPWSVLPLLSCLLTVAASGDDFCFARLVLLPSSLTAGLLPLDDPNTDFVNSAGSGLARRSNHGQRPVVGEGLRPGAINPASNGFSAPLDGTLTARRHLLHEGVNTPLRC
jgi:hypothetical protein